MMRGLIGIGLLLFAVSAFAQSDRGSITGTVSYQGVAVAVFTVQAKDTTTGTVYKVLTSKTGTFTIPDLPAGTYEVSVPRLGLSTARYVKENVIVAARETVHLDISLPTGGQGAIADDGAFLAIHNTYAGLTGPAPKTADGKPDFSGVWLANVDPNPEPAAPLPWAAEIVKERIANHLQGLPSAMCLPISPFPPFFAVLHRIVQTPQILVQLFGAEPHYRQVYLDGRPHPQDPDPTWMGHSIGHWEGDTLVIDSTGFNDKSWFGGEALPHTEMLHVIERYRRPDLAHLNVDVTIEDPGTFSKPLQRHTTWEFAPGEDIEEYICTENNKYLENTDHK